MKTIKVQASSCYDVLIGKGILSHVGEYTVNIHKPCIAAIVSDTNVWDYYGHKVTDSFTKAGFQVIAFTFAPGESSKSLETYGQILQFLAQNKATKSDLLISLGGGVVGDMTGFAAATYLRGISYMQIPTSLLAMVDSSVGGKTAIDLPIGKNLIGAFKQPCLVVCDVDVLDTLPREIFLDGCAEVIKYGFLYDSDLIHYLSEVGTNFDREDVVAKCIGYKRNVVCQDEFDTGVRQKLNFGHTLGHGIEKESNYTISHGRAVAAGMAVITKACCRRDLCDAEVYTALCSLLQQFSLPFSTKYSADALFSAALSDKKRSGNTVNLILPVCIGSCRISPTPIMELEEFIKDGL